MARRSESSPLLGLTLEPGAPRALHRQLYDQIRQAVLSGRLAAGDRLPSSRTLASELGCSRNTVTNAFELLFAEGYLEGQTGSGTYVSRVLPEALLFAHQGHAKERSKRKARATTFSSRGQALTGLRLPPPAAGGAFAPNLPEVGDFPFETWARLLGRTWRNPSTRLLRRGDLAGYRPLRRAIASYLKALRALDCGEEQVLITSGTQHALDLVARLLLEPGDRVWIEEPGYSGLRGPLVAAGAKLVPVPVDRAGLSVSQGRQLAPEARMAVATPSHQYPLGVTMSLTRRLELLAWAREQEAWVVEDDYDSEFRYDGRPLAALQGLDEDGRVIYLGTFSKVMFPTLRIGYLVVPPDLVEPLARARALLEDQPTILAQPALAAFIEEGHFAAHIRRMRRLYAARQEVLLEAAGAALEGLVQLAPDSAGMHLLGDLGPALAGRLTDQAASERAAAVDVTVPALSSYYLGSASRQGLLFGYAAVAEPELRAAVRRLANALRD